MTWVVVPAAGKGARFGGDLPKQYVQVFGSSLLHHTLSALCRHPGVSGAQVVLAKNDKHWPGWREMHGKPVRSVVGGAERADSVLAGLRGLPDEVRERDWVLVHDAARPCLPHADLSRLLDLGGSHTVGALLAEPVRDTIKRSNAEGEAEHTVPRDTLWRAQTPQMFRRATLLRALESALAAGLPITDEAMAVERLGLWPLLVEGSCCNLKVTTADDLAVAEFWLGRLAGKDSG